MRTIGSVLYLIGWIFYKSVYTLVFRVKISGVKNFPKKGGVLIASNHLSMADPPLVGSCLWRPIHYMAKKELFSSPVFGWILRKVNAFPVNRKGTDMGAIRTVKRLLSEGEIVLVFPQGGRRNEDNFDVKSGIGMLSCWSQSPIVPCCIKNSNKLKEFKRLEVNFLEPVFPPEKYGQDTYTVLTNKVASEMKEELQRGK
ncbi:MAG: 1-acyl-sn-glycerol-3-phosphate acyltransferase [Elusimicrobia bacterium]|nr:1-acyl-sn-glycerol-3-phosphate acyltransferase [Elusimicrobiota bacterium]